MAYSDHNVLIDHTDLNDEKFLALTATEIDVTTRRIAALENRKKQRASASKPKLYDRCV